jgi:outer membrane lipoprotein
MKKLSYIPILFAGLIWGCSVMPKTLQDQAVKDSFPDLIRQGQAAVGQKVIAGGYVLSVENLGDVTRIEAVQAPLGFDEKPKSKDLSQGRLILDCPGFLDPEVYRPDRKITIGGKLLESAAPRPGDRPYPYLHVKVEAIHLWPIEPPVVYYEPDPLMGDPWYYPFPWYGFPRRHY